MRIFSDIRYGDLVGASKPAQGNRYIGAVKLVLASGREDAIVTNESKRRPAGLILMCLLLLLTRRRTLILTEFLPGERGRVLTAAYRWLLPRVLLRAQVMTAWEQDAYTASYRIPKDRLVLIPFYRYDDRLVGEPLRLNLSQRTGWISTGRSSCDWDTLLKAAQGRGWPLEIICRSSEREQISVRAQREGIRVRSDIPRDEHDQALADARLLILSLHDHGVSAGHIRLMTAATFGVPVVASTVRGIRGYEELAVRLVAPGDSDGLRSAVEELEQDDSLLLREQDRVRAYALERPYSTYAEELRRFITGLPG